jgi:hypothetical protein
VEKADASSLVFEAADVLNRVEREGDVAAAILRGGPALPRSR